MLVPIPIHSLLLRGSVCALAAAALALGNAAVAQTVNIYHVAWNSTDATENIRQAIANATPPSKIILDVHPTPWYVSDTIVLNQHDMQIWFANGATVKAKAGGFTATNACMFKITANNVKMNGYANGVDTNGGVTTLEMRKTDYMSAPYAAGESRHLISVRGGGNAIIEGFNLLKSGGDGIAVNNAPTDGTAPPPVLPGSPPFNVTITDVTSDDNYRQGMSIFSVDTLTVTNCTFKNTGLTGGTAPRAGVDIEPSVSTQILKGIKFVSCQFTGNSGNNLEINLHALTGAGLDPIDLRFESCQISNGSANGMAFYALDPLNGPTGTIVVKNTTVTGTPLSGVIFSNWGVDRVPITMANVDLVECSQGGPPPLLWTQTGGTIVQHGDVVFQSGCHIHESFTRTNALVYVGSYIQNGPGMKDVTGTIDYHRPANSTGPIMVLGSNVVNCTLTVTPAP
jgi:hypothetical protein